MRAPGCQHFGDGLDRAKPGAMRRKAERGPHQACDEDRRPPGHDGASSLSDRGRGLGFRGQVTTLRSDPRRLGPPSSEHVLDLSMWMPPGKAEPGRRSV
jgi:hypothetical protein